MMHKSTIPIAIVVGGMIVATAVYVSMPTPPSKNAGNSSLVRPVSASDHILGNPAAPVMIVEYSDFDCTYCKDFHDTLNHIIANAGVNGNVAWVFRHFPLSEIHQNAISHARASECIAATSGNEAFWKFSNALFRDQSVDTSMYGAIASSIGISDDAFATCFSVVSSAIDARIMKDRQNAIDMGAEGTPYSIVLIHGKNPIIVDGAYSYDAMKEIIDQALTKI